MTSGKPLSTLEQAYIDTVRGRLSHSEVAAHLTLLYGTPRTRKGVIDYCHRVRSPAFS
ncbi:MAG: hypothetical protein WC379_16895 [Methanoregula sp.]